MTSERDFALAPEIELHIIPGTPKEVSPSAIRDYTTENLTITLCSNSDFGPQAWDPYFPVMHYNVHLKDGSREHIADFDIDYDYATKTIAVDNVGIIDPENMGKGYGIQMYSIVPSMLLPDGRTAQEAGFTFITETHSPEAERVWRGLAKRGLATSVGPHEWGGNSYIWNSYDDAE